MKKIICMVLMLSTLMSTVNIALPIKSYAENEGSEIELYSTDNIINVTSVDEMQSEHPYSSNTDITYVYTHQSDADSLNITFSDDTEVESNYDFIYIYDENDVEIDKYTGTELAGQTVEISGNVAKIRLTSDSSVTRNGFTVTSIDAVLSTGPIANLRYTSRTKDSVTLSFPAPKEATNVTVEQSVDGKEWITSTTTEALDASSAITTVTGLEMETQYYFRLNVVGGRREGLSNEISVTTYGIYTSAESFEFSNGTINGYIGQDEDVIIPPEINGIPVTRIGEKAFYQCEKIISVVIPDSVTIINEFAFAYCSKLINITFGNHTTSIGDFAFCGCTSLVDLNLPDSITTIGFASFSDCSKLVNINIPNGVTSLGQFAFSNCSELISITIPNGITNIGQATFQNCTNLAIITIPSSVTYIGPHAFLSCIGLDDIYFRGTKEQWEQISVDTNNNWMYNATIHFSEDEEDVISTYTIVYDSNGGSGAPNQQTKHLGESIIVSSVIPTREGYTFLGWATTSDATDVEYSSGATFAVDADTTLYAVWAVNNSDNGEDNNIVASGDCGDNLSWTLDDEGILTISGEGDMGDFSSDSMPWDSNVPWYNFKSSIKEVVIGENVTSISHYAFYQCRNIEKIYWNAKNIKDFSSDNCIFYNAGHDSDGIELIFSDNVENIPAYLSNPSISYDLSPKIKSIEFGNNIVTIGRSAFYGCMDIVEITIPETVEQIQDGAFWYCNSLSHVYYNGSKSEWGNISIGSNNTCLTNANIHYSELNNVINVSNINDLQSEHPYSSNEDTTWVYTHPSEAETLQATFSNDTETESGYDFIYIYDKFDNLIGEYSGTELARKTISVDGNVIKIKLVSDGSVTGNGFAVSAINANAYILTYDANGGSGAPDTQIRNKGESITLSAVIPVRKGYVFKGWATDSNAAEAEYLSGSIFNIDADITLYAVWEANIFNGLLYTIDNNQVTITGFDNSISDVIIPSEIGGYPVVKIDEWAFEYADNLGSVVLPCTVKNIGYGAFYGCYNLREIEIPDGIIRIEDYAFAECNLSWNCMGSDFVLPNSITHIGNGAFALTNISNIVLPSGLTTIKGDTFDFCESLTEITIPSSVTTIEDRAFNGCSNLQNVYFDGTKEELELVNVEDETLKSLTINYKSFVGAVVNGTCGTNVSWEINENGTLTISGEGTMDDWFGSDYAPWYSYKDNIYHVIINDGVSNIGAWAFYECTNIESIELSNSILNIGEGAFDSCKNLKEVVVPDSVAKIDDWTFNGCSKLEQITLSNQLTSIGEGAFNSCYNLSGIILPETLQTIGERAFAYCTSLEKISIPNDISILKDRIFDGCRNLKEVFISNGLKSIGELTFNGCLYLTQINVSADNPYLCSIDGVLFDKNIKELIHYPHGKSAEKYVVPESVLSINDDAFYDNYTLKEIDAKNVVNIGNYVFRNATALQKITFERIITIGVGAFYDCPNMESIYLPSTLKNVGESAFHLADGLTIYGYENSYAEYYANSYDIAFVSIGVSSENITKDQTKKYIYNSEQLKDITSGEYILENDIYLSGSWEPICPEGNVILDGAGYKIYNLNVNIDDNAGLFGYSRYDITIKNLGLDYTTKRTSVTGKLCTGSFIGQCWGNVYIENSYNLIDVYSPYAIDFLDRSYKATGGFVGDVKTSVTIVNSYNRGSVESQASSGGLIGICTGNVSVNNCYNNGNVIGGSEYDTGFITSVGGIVADAGYLSIENSYNSGKISGTLLVGGIAADTKGNILNCYNIGTIEQRWTYDHSNLSYVGGIVSSLQDGSIIDCYNEGEISGMSSGGIVGDGDDVIIKNSHNLAKITGNDVSGGIAASHGNIKIEDCYNIGEIVGENSAGGIVGDGNWVYGDRHILNCSNSGIIRSNGASGGLVVGISGDTINGISGDVIINSNNSGQVQGSKCAAGISTHNIGTIESCYNNGYIESDNIVGGLVGTNTGTIINSNNSGSVSGLLSSGGISGVDSGTIENCYNTGKVSANDKVGGLVGTAESNQIKSSYNKGTVSGTTYTGGIVGYGSTLLEDSQNIGVLVSSNINNLLGGLIGYVDNALTVNSQCSFIGASKAYGGKADNAIIIGPEDIIGSTNDDTFGDKPVVNEERYKEITFHVVGYPEDEIVFEGEPVENATVTFRGASKKTDESGNVTFYKDELSAETGGVSVTADGYWDYDASEIWVMPFDGVDTISLTKKNPEKIYITNLYAVSTTGEKYDLKIRNDFSVDKTDTSTYKFRIDVDWNNHDAGKVYLKGDKSGKSFEFVNGEVSISPGVEFEVGENVKVVVYTADETKSETEENLINVIALPEEFSLVIPQVFDDTMSSLDFMVGKSFQIGVDTGIEKFAEKVDVVDGKLVIEFSGSIGDGSSSKKKGRFEIFDGKYIEVEPHGKIELPLTVDNSEWKGIFGVDGKADPIVEYDWNKWVYIPGVGYIPVTATVKFSGGVSSELELSGGMDKVSFDGKISPFVTLDAFGGLGADYDTVEMKAGVYVNAKGELEIVCHALDPESEFNPSLAGEVGVRAKIKVWIIELEGEEEAGKFRWNKEGLRTSWFGDDVSLFSLRNDSWQLSGREYLENGGGFIGGNNIALFDLEVTNKDEQIIYNNIFDNAEAVLENIDDRTVLVYTVDDIEREEQNSLKLVYSEKLSDGTWSEPVTIDDDGTLDSIISADEKFVVWEDMKSELSDTSMQMKDILAQTEISAAYYDGENWISTQLTSNDIYDFSPTIKTNGNIAIATWLSNTESDFTSQSGVTNIHYATFDGTNWSEITTIKNVGTVTRVTAAYNGDTPYIFYKKDGVIYSVSATDGTTTTLSYSGVGQYAIDTFNNKIVLAYFDTNGNLKVSDDVLNSSVASTVTTEAEVNSIPVIATNNTDMYIGWIDHQNGYDTLCGVRYENGVWSNKITFIGEEANVSNPSLIANDDGTFSASYFKTGKVEISESGEYTTGEVNLFVNNISPSYNIAIDNETLTYNDEIYAKGNVAAITFDVKNVGEKSVSGFDVEIYENDELKKTISKTFEIRAGATENVHVSYVPTDSEKIQELQIKIVPIDADDFDESDNVATISLGTVDATVTSAFFTKEGRTNYVNAVIRNNGSVTADKIVVSIRKGSQDGEIIYQTDIENVLSYEELLVKTEISANNLAESSLFYVLVGAQNDVNVYNNNSIAVKNNGGYVEEKAIIFDRATNTATIKSEKEYKGAVVFFATYNNGKLVSLKKVDKDLIVGENTATPEDFSLDGADTVKVMVWESSSNIKPLFEVCVVELK